MQITFRCQSCCQQRPINPRLKGKQNYCGLPACQRARKKRWHQQAMATDEDYRAQQQECMQKWRKERPLHRYQKGYRANHPAYVEANRQKQRIRNHNRQKHAPPQAYEMIVKMDALTIEESNAYVMTSFTIDASANIVKMDTLFVQLQRFQADGQGNFAGVP